MPPQKRSSRLTDEELSLRKEALLADVHERLAGAQGTLSKARKDASQSRIRMRTLLLPALGIVLFLHFGSRAGAPLGVNAAFTPGGGESFAGPRVFTADEIKPGAGEIRLAPGDVVGTTSGSPGVLELGNGRLILEPGARALISSLMPPRVRLIGGDARAEGRLRIITAHGVFDLESGAATLTLNSTVGLLVEQVEGEGVLVGPQGEVKLSAGDRSASR